MFMSDLQLFQVLGSINEELGRHRGQSDRQSVLYVVLSVRVWSMCCGNVYRRHRVVGIGGQRGLDPP